MIVLFIVIPTVHFYYHKNQSITTYRVKQSTINQTVVIKCRKMSAKHNKLTKYNKLLLL